MVDNTLEGTLGAAFFGFTLGAILYGITILQLYQYYSNSKHSGRDSLCVKSIVGSIGLLDTLHIAFATHIMYSYLVQGFGDQSAANLKRAIWSFKAMGSVQVVLVVFVHLLYLHRIWKLTNRLFLSKWLLVGLLITAFISLVVATIFMIELQGVNDVLNFPSSFQYMIYAGFGTSVIIDCGIAATLCLILHRRRVGVCHSDGSTSNTNGVVQVIIQYCIATGFLTSLTSLLCVILYVANPESVLYLAADFSVTRLYAISILAMFNARHRFRERLNEDIELRMTSILHFNEPEAMHSYVSLVPEKTTSDTEGSSRERFGKPFRKQENRYQTA